MSTNSVRSAIQNALKTTGNREPNVTRDEARSIIDAATTGARGADPVSKSEGKLLARLIGESSSFGGVDHYALTSAAKNELEGFFEKRNLPYGANAEKMRAKIASGLAQAQLGGPLSSAPSTRDLVPLVIDDSRRVDGLLREALVDPAKGQYFLKTTSGPGMGGVEPSSRWYGPFSVDGAGSVRERDLAALRSEISAATEDLFFMSESDYPFDFFLAEGAGTSAPTGAELLKILGKPAETLVEERDFEQFFARRTTPEEDWDDSMKADALKYEKLRAALTGSLTDLKVIRLGEIEIGVYIVGRNEHGDLVGVSTTSIET